MTKTYRDELACFVNEARLLPLGHLTSSNCDGHYGSIDNDMICCYTIVSGAKHHYSYFICDVFVALITAYSISG